MSHYDSPPSTPDLLSSTGQPPSDEQPSHSKRGFKVVLIAAVMALVAGGGAFALYRIDPLHMFGDEAQAAQALPAGALFYTGVDLDPTASQKVKAMQFLGHFPAFEDAIHLEDSEGDVRERMLTPGIDELDCEGVTYDKSIKPWLGGKAGFALLPPNGDDTEPVPVLAVEVTGQDAAAEGLAALGKCATSEAERFGYEFVGDYAVLAETQDIAASMADQATAASLADDPDFRNDMESLGDLGVGTLWADVEGALDVASDDILSETEGSGTSQEMLDYVRSRYQRVAATFRFEADRVEVVATARGDTPEIEHGANQIARLPDSTALAFSVAGGAERFSSSWDDLKEVFAAEGLDIDQELTDFEAETGISVPGDVEVLLGDNLMFSLDSEGLTAEALTSETLGAVNLGVRLTGDGEAQSQLYEKVSNLLGQGVDIPLTTRESTDGFVLASNDAYADTLDELSGNLGASEAFRSVIGDASSQEQVLFFSWDLVEDELLQSSEIPANVSDNLTPLQAFGMTSDVDGNYTTYVLRMAVND